MCIGFTCVGVKTSDPLEPELQTIVSCHVGAAGNWTQVLWKSNQCSNHWAISSANWLALLEHFIVFLLFLGGGEAVSQVSCWLQPCTPKWLWNSDIPDSNFYVLELQTRPPCQAYIMLGIKDRPTCMQGQHSAATFLALLFLRNTVYCRAVVGARL